MLPRGPVPAPGPAPAPGAGRRSREGHPAQHTSAPPAGVPPSPRLFLLTASVDTFEGRDREIEDVTAFFFSCFTVFNFVLIQLNYENKEKKPFDKHGFCLPPVVSCERGVAGGAGGAELGAHGHPALLGGQRASEAPLSPGAFGGRPRPGCSPKPRPGERTARRLSLISTWPLGAKRHLVLSRLLPGQASGKADGHPSSLSPGSAGPTHTQDTEERICGQGPPPPKDSLCRASHWGPNSRLESRVPIQGRAQVTAGRACQLLAALYKIVTPRAAARSAGYEKSAFDFEATSPAFGAVIGGQTPALCHRAELVLGGRERDRMQASQLPRRPR